MIRPEQWQPADGLLLEPNALLAAREPTRSLALTAGPGAGKTEMLAQRADFLLRTGTSRYPQRILAIAFKVDAARNLKERVRRRCGAELSARLDSHTFHAFAKRLIDRFRVVLTGPDVLDADFTIGHQRISRRQITFKDMVPLAVSILKTSAVARNAVRQTYSHVFLDEFQDCTQEQYELIHTAFHGTPIPLTAVGDTKQRIMGWAGAMEGIFEQFVADFGALTRNLYQNFRSQPRLRRMQNAMVRVMDPDAAVPEDELKGDAGSIENVAFASCRDEARSLAGRILEWTRQGLAPSQVAVLVPRWPELYARGLMEELGRVGVAFRDENALQDLSTEPVAQLIVDFLRVVVGEREAEAYGRLMGVLVGRGADEEAESARWHRFIEPLRDHVRRPGASIPDAALLHAWSTALVGSVGPEALRALSSDYEQGTRLEELVAQTHDRIAGLLALEKDAAKALARFGEDSAVRIMTIHKCKGLEFDTVILLGVEEQTFWAKPVEERALYFVGVSRARSRLVLTTAQRRDRPAGHAGAWYVARTPHAEFLGYAQGVM